MHNGKAVPSGWCPVAQERTFLSIERVLARLDHAKIGQRRGDYDLPDVASENIASAIPTKKLRALRPRVRVR